MRGNDSGAGGDGAGPATGPEDVWPADVPEEIRQAHAAVAEYLTESLWPRVRREEESGGIAPGTLNVRAVGLTLADESRPAGRENYALSVALTEPATEEEVRGVLASPLGGETASRIPIRVVVSEEPRLDVAVSPQYEGAYGKRGWCVREAPCGMSIGTFRECVPGYVDGGTLGCLARGKSGERRGQTLGLSCRHVLASNWNDSVIGDRILQQGRFDGSKPDDPKFEVGVLEKMSDIVLDGNTKNLADAATFAANVDQQTGKLSVDRRIVDDVTGKYLLVPLGGDIKSPEDGMKVGKSGRTTGVTFGYIYIIKETRAFQNFMHTGRTAVFKDVIVIKNHRKGERPSKPGDSGSVWWTDDGKRNPVGLHFAGGATVADEWWHAYAFPMRTIVQVLDIELITGR